MLARARLHHPALLLLTRRDTHRHFLILANAHQHHQVAEALRNMDAAFPTFAAPNQPIKLPRQHNVDKEEYREFLNLGHGEIFGLDLDRCACVRVWAVCCLFLCGAWGWV